VRSQLRGGNLETLPDVFRLPRRSTCSKRVGVLRPSEIASEQSEEKGRTGPLAKPPLQPASSWQYVNRPTRLEPHDKVVSVPHVGRPTPVLGAAPPQVTLVLLGANQLPALGTDGHRPNSRAELDTCCGSVLAPARGPTGGGHTLELKAPEEFSSFVARSLLKLGISSPHNTLFRPSLFRLLKQESRIRVA
jgi:hypothetical protein